MTLGSRDSEAPGVGEDEEDSLVLEGVGEKTLRVVLWIFRPRLSVLRGRV